MAFKPGAKAGRTHFDLYLMGLAVVLVNYGVWAGSTWAIVVAALLWVVSQYISRRLDVIDRREQIQLYQRQDRFRCWEEAKADVLNGDGYIVWFARLHSGVWWSATNDYVEFLDAMDCDGPVLMTDYMGSLRRLKREIPADRLVTISIKARCALAASVPT